jgi:hypothetical protein
LNSAEPQFLWKGVGWEPNFGAYRTLFIYSAHGNEPTEAKSNANREIHLVLCWKMRSGGGGSFTATANGKHPDAAL